MNKSKVLYIHITGVSSEILKNMVLAGIRPVLCDNRPFPQAIQDTPSMFWQSKSLESVESNGKDDALQEKEPPSKRVKKESTTTVAKAIQSAVQELNPLLGDCQILDCPNLEDLEDVVSLVKDYDIVVASRISVDLAVRLSQACANNENSSKSPVLFLVDTFGMHGACAIDWGPNQYYRPEVGKKLLDPQLLQPYVSLNTMLNVPLQDATNRFHKQHPPEGWVLYRCLLEYIRQTKTWPTNDASKKDFVKIVRNWLQETSPKLMELDLVSDQSLEQLASVATCEISPVCTVLGGFVGNEIIKAISGKGEPANNTVLFEGSTCKTWTFLVKPKD